MKKDIDRWVGQRYAKISKSRDKGFTLIELVVVIAIMAILALIMVPSLTAYINKADDTRLMADMKNIHTASQMVIQTNDDLSIDALTEDYLKHGHKFVTEVEKLTNSKIENGMTIQAEDGKIVVKKIIGGTSGGEYTFDGENFNTPKGLMP